MKTSYSQYDLMQLPSNILQESKQRALLVRRSFLAAALLPLCAKAIGMTDVLDRPASLIRLGSKPSMFHITRAGDRLVAVGERGVILWSDDNGQHWVQARVPVSVSLTRVQFINERLGWAIGHAGVVLSTVDGGLTWIRQLDGRQIITAMQIRADELLLKKRDDLGTLLAVKLAANAAADGPDKPLFALHFSDSLNGWVAGAFGLAMMTNDGGKTWQSRCDILPNPKNLHFYGVSRIGSQMFFAGEQGLLLSAAVDGGSAATAIDIEYRGSLFASSVQLDNNLLLGGLKGTLLMRTISGEIKPIESGTTRAIISITSLPNDAVALVDQAGKLLLGSIATGRFASVGTDTGLRLVSIAQARDGSLVGAGSFGAGRIALSK